MSRQHTKRAAHASRSRKATPANALTDVQRTFALEYLRNGDNGTQAYLATHPKATAATAATEAWKLLRIPKIAAFLQAERTARWQALAMEADEALALISETARIDVTRFLDEQGELLPASQWPAGAGLLVKGLKPGPFGTTLILHDALKARELMAINAGKLRGAIDHTHTFDHAGALAYLASKTPDPEAQP